MTYVRHTKATKSKMIIWISLIGLLLVSSVVVVYFINKPDAEKMTVQSTVVKEEQQELEVVSARDEIQAVEMSEKEILLQGDLAKSGDWYGEEDRLMEHIFQMEAIPATIEAGSVVDIKLFKPMDTDDIVVAKTVVIGKANNTLSFYLDKVEQENIKEANTEGLLFLVQYLDQSQPASAVTYEPKYKEQNAKW